MSTLPRILLLGPYKPYGTGEYVSDRPQYMELLENQLTRYQDGSSPRKYHHTFGLHFIAANLDAPVMILEFPTWNEFLEEIEGQDYDYIGIGSILPNFSKVQKMCQAIRACSPQSKIVIGGHIANLPGLEAMIECDQVVAGEGISWFRRLIGQDTNRPIAHPVLPASFGTTIMGLPVPQTKSCTLIPGVGCPMGCKFCSTSAMFGGKGCKVDFYQSIDQVYSLMVQMADRRGTDDFFVMDENFLGRTATAERLAELMERDNREWSLHIFSTARHIRTAGFELMDRLGVVQVWMGLENEDGSYGHKLAGIDTIALVEEMRERGIVVIGSTILGELDHDAAKTREVYRQAIRHCCDLHQFMLLTALPGTPIYREYSREGRMSSWEECPPEDHHGALRFNFSHPSIPPGAEADLIKQAFEADLARNGPSSIRNISTVLNLRQRLKHSPDRRQRKRVLKYSDWLSRGGVALSWALSRLGDPTGLSERTYKRLIDEFGWRARLSVLTYGNLMWGAWFVEKAMKLLGWNPEPDTCRWANAAATKLGLKTASGQAEPIDSVLPERAAVEQVLAPSSEAGLD